MKDIRMILIVILTACIFSLAACGSSDKEDAESSSDGSDQQVNDETPIRDAAQNSNKNTTGTATENIDSRQSVDKKSSAENKQTNDVAKSANTTGDIPNSKKASYIKRLNDTKKASDEKIEHLKETSTYALKNEHGQRYDGWDAILNEIYGVLKEQLAPEKMGKLRMEQRNWLTFRDDTALEASQKYKGGTQEHLEYVIVLADLTENRCFELVEKYME